MKPNYIQIHQALKHSNYLSYQNKHDAFLNYGFAKFGSELKGEHVHEIMNNYKKNDTAAFNLLDKSNPHVTKKHIETIMSDPSAKLLKRACLHHPNCSAETLKNALHDKSLPIRETARKVIQAHRDKNFKW